MKKLIFAIMMITSIAYNSVAQEYKSDIGKRLAFGLKLGTNYSNVYDSKGQDFNADAKFGLAGGAFLTIPIGSFIGIQPEVLFSQRGFKATGSVLGNSYDFTRTTSYIDVPLLFAVKPLGFLTILGGPQYSYLLKQKDVFANSSANTQQEQDFKNDNVRKNTLCFTGGLDINVEHLVVSGRIGWDIQKNNGDGTSTTPRYKDVWYQFTLGYRLY